MEPVLVRECVHLEENMWGGNDGRLLQKQHIFGFKNSNNIILGVEGMTLIS